jgi:hypothetical protein
MLQTWSVSPACIAGVTRNVLWTFVTMHTEISTPLEQDQQTPDC